MKGAVLLRVFLLPNQSKAFRKDAVFSLLPPFSTGCAKMVGFPYAHKSRAFELKHGAASRNTWSGLLGLRASLPRNRIGGHLAPITDVATSVGSSVRVQDLSVPT